MKHVSLRKICLFTALILVTAQSFLIYPEASRADSASIVRTGDASYGGSKVGTFTVNDETAFCVEHDKNSTPTGSANKGESVYDNDNIRRALYYGWNGDGNIFGKDRDRGYVVTSLILSRLYTGTDAGGHSIDGYSELWNLANNGSIPSHSIDFSDHKLSTHIDGDKQVSQESTFEADSDNTITFTLPDGMHLTHDDTGMHDIGKVTLKGGERFHLWASLDYNNDWSSGDVTGSMKVYQPFLTIVTDKSNQNLMRYYQVDPPQYNGISARFYPRTVQETIHYKDRETGQEVHPDTTKTVTIGSHYDEWNIGNQWFDNHTENTIGDAEQQGTVPSNNYDLTFWYSTQWTLHAQYIDTWTGQVMWTEDTPNIWVGSNYDKWASQGEFDRDGHHYKETGQNHFTGAMPRGDLTVSFYYDPYNHARVTWQNAYPNNDVFKSADDLVKVGNGYYYDQPGSFTTDDGRVFDRINGDTFNGSQPYNDISHVFQYHLRRHVEVNYYDNRTGQKIKDSKEYDLHQGDAYSESSPDITTSRNNKTYHYRFVKATGNAQSGTIGTDNITINYYYDVPLMQIGVKDLQVYTAPKEDGLPVKVALDKLYNYDTSIGDMDSKTLNVSLYQGSTQIATTKFAANKVPDNLTFKIPAAYLSGVKAEDGSKLPYTVRFSAYDANDFDVIPSEQALTTDGYTSSKATILFDVNSNSSHQDSLKQVVRTETSSDGKYNDTPTNETFQYYARPLPANKTGYGSAANLQYTYLNGLGDDYQYATKINEDAFTFQAPEKLQDTSYLDYAVKDGLVNVPMTESAQNVDLVGSNYQRNETFVFPHMNVEDDTGDLFTDKQVATHDTRIHRKIYDGGNQFYTPIWPDKSINIPATFHVDYESNALGANQVTLKLADHLKLVAYMYAWMGSPTIGKDELLMEPVNTDNPFPDGLPAGFTKADEQWIEKD
ncbi:MAG: MucBP domain-containing protein [Sporolactobacillus sp.]